MFKDKNTLIGFLLIFAILIGFSILNTPSQEEIERHKARQDSIKITQAEVIDNEPYVEQINNNAVSEAITQSNSEIEGTTVDDRYNNIPFLYAENIEAEQVYYVENNLFTIGFSNVGGKIKEFKFNEDDFLKWDKTSLYLINNSLNKFGLTFFANNRPVHTSDLRFEPVFYDTKKQDTIKSTQDKPIKFGMRLFPYASNNTDEKDVQESWLEFVYIIYHDSYKIDFQIDFHNANSFLSSNTTSVDFEMEANLFSQEKNTSTEKMVSTVYYRFLNDDVKYLSEKKNAKEALRTKVQWVSFKQQFFSFTLISDLGFQSADVEVFNDEYIRDEDYLRTMKSVMTLPIEKFDQTIPLSLYVGPNKYKTMRSYDLELEKQIPLGWSFFLLAWINRYAVIPVFNFLESFNLSYGIIILILTILLKIVLLPIAYKTYISSARMKVLKPEIDIINKKFPKKEDAMKKQQATMDLYKKAGVSPMSGCLPMLLQFPILIAMFRFFPASIELRQKSFLWASDLSTYDSILDLPFTIPFYGDHVSLFTLLMTVSTIIYTRMNSQNMASSNQMPGMKMMMYMMPIMFLGFFNSYSSALSYYYFLANIITFGQMWLFRQIINDQKILDKIQENKTKKTKKSGFQKRLEEMSRQQQQQQRRKK